MCGIAGIINLDQKPVDEKKVEKMIKIIKYRGPDDEGYYINGSVGLGHCRLSIIDLSKAGHQPMTNVSRDLWMVYNGEIYNYLELREKLKKIGYQFKSNTDTEVIIYAYKEWGEKCLEKFNGMWAFAIWDDKKQRLFCARDRFGIKPFYYYLDDKKFIFASEIKAILENNDIKRLPNDRLIYDYLVYDQEEHTDKTFFKGIFKLPPGRYLLIKNKKLEIKTWWQLNPKPLKLKKETDYQEKFHRLLNDSIKLRLRSDVPIGTCLSGGLDSSSIVCIVNKLMKQDGETNKKTTFTSCYNNQPAIDEREYVEEIVKKIGVKKNYIFPAIEDLQKNLNRLVWHQEEPFSSLSIYAQWAVMERGKEKKVKVILDGQGGDEVLLGYERYYVYFLLRLIKEFRFIRMIKEANQIIKNSKLNFFQFFKYFLYFSAPKIRSIYLNKRAKKILNKNFLKSKKEKTSSIHSKRPTDLQLLQKLEITRLNLPNLLKYEDKNSSAFSIEARTPFLDYRLVEFAFNLPYDLKIKNGWSKYLLRKSMKNILPEKIRWRKNKIGFEVPQKAWLTTIKTEIKKIFSQEIHASKYLNRYQILKCVENNNFDDRILWRALNLELWMRIFKL
ncbi:MAG: asparagine synthase (glutamine-hydrolyzing) [Patescibacteria group bacterium]|nr:asparagine synthase (glutamine-hydrolyzing) [Patescibacteria group bacterium]